MSISTYSSLRQKMRRPTQRLDIAKATGWASGTNWNSSWLDAGGGGAGATPSTAAVPTRATAGALGQKNKSASALLRAVMRRANGVLSANNTLQAGGLILADRLSHQGGLSGTTTGAQTTNLPTAALTRYTSGVNVWAGLEIFASVGTSGSTVTASYTNSDGTASRTSQVMQFGISGYSGQRCLIPITMQQGDRGVKSVESVTLSGSTGSAGNFGVVLFKTLMMIPAVLFYSLARDMAPIPWMGGLVEILDDACLELLTYGGGQTGVGVACSIDLFED